MGLRVGVDAAEDGRGGWREGEATQGATHSQVLVFWFFRNGWREEEHTVDLASERQAGKIVRGGGERLHHFEQLEADKGTVKCFRAVVAKIIFLWQWCIAGLCKSYRHSMVLILC